MSLPTISVVIPVLDEAEHISSIKASVAQQTYIPHEVIVIDGGSTDDSLTKFKELGFTTLTSKKGRGNQIYAGTKKATGDIIFVMHGDMHLKNNVLQDIAKAMSSPNIDGGCVDSSFNSSSLRFKFLEIMNFTRARFMGISFGDQGQFFRRQKALNEHWIQEIPLMEDVELSLRMPKKVILNGGILASTRRWKTRSVLINAFHVAYLLSKYLYMRKYKKNFSTQKFYDEYYKNGR